MSCFLPFSHALLSHSAHPFFQWLPRTRACDRPPTCWSSTWQRLTCCSSCFACLSLPSTTCCPSGPSESIGASLYVTLYAKKGVFLSPLMGSWQTSKQLRREAASRLLMPPFLLPFSFRQVQYMIVVTAHASAYTLVLMSLDRFLAVVHPITSMSIRTERNASL